MGRYVWECDGKVEKEVYRVIMSKYASVLTYLSQFTEGNDNQIFLSSLQIYHSGMAFLQTNKSSKKKFEFIRESTYREAITMG